MKAPGSQTGHEGDAQSIPAHVGLCHADGQPVMLEDAAQRARALTERITARSQAMRSLEALGRQCDPFKHARLSQEARLDAFRVRVWTGLASLASEGASL